MGTGGIFSVRLMIFILLAIFLSIIDFCRQKGEYLWGAATAIRYDWLNHNTPLRRVARFLKNRAF